jgi:hypothetical protein
MVLLPLRGRSRASALLHLTVGPGGDGCTNQDAKSVSSSSRCSSTRKFRHHKTRLGCRLNAGGAQWAERHGCRESAARTWMSVQRGPTERRRSEGIRRSRAQPGAGPFWLLFRLLEKVTRRGAESESVPPSITTGTQKPAPTTTQNNSNLAHKKTPPKRGSRQTEYRLTWPDK